MEENHKETLRVIEENHKETVRILEKITDLNK
jgi:hypothetical protein